jgi:F0F1-type ATP synthase assembly protein I
VKRPEDDTTEGMSEGYALLTVGITFALTVTAGLLIGRWADRRFGTTPLLLIGGTLLGIGFGGFWAWLRVSRQGGRKK